MLKSAGLSFKQYLSYLEYKLKVQQIDSICGQFTKCGGAAKLSKCPSNMLAKVKLEDDQMPLCNHVHQYDIWHHQ